MAMEELNRNEIAARLKQWQAEALVRMTCPATEKDRRAYHDGEAAAYANALRLIGGEE